MVFPLASLGLCFHQNFPSKLSTNLIFLVSCQQIRIAKYKSSDFRWETVQRRRRSFLLATEIINFAVYWDSLYPSSTVVNSVVSNEILRLSGQNSVFFLKYNIIISILANYVLTDCTGIFLYWQVCLLQTFRLLLHRMYIFTERLQVRMDPFSFSS